MVIETEHFIRSIVVGTLGGAATKGAAKRFSIELHPRADSLYTV